MVDLQEYYDNKFLSDFIIISDGKIIHLHRFVLAAYFPYWKRRFQEEKICMWKNTQYDHNTLVSVLKHCYGISQFDHFSELSLPFLIIVKDWEMDNLIRDYFEETIGTFGLYKYCLNYLFGDELKTLINAIYLADNDQKSSFHFHIIGFLLKRSNMDGSPKDLINKVLDDIPHLKKYIKDNYLQIKEDTTDIYKTFFECLDKIILFD